MKTYTDRYDLLTKVKCEYCNVGIPIYEAAQLVKMDEEGRVIEKVYGHELCLRGEISVK